VATVVKTVVGLCAPAPLAMVAYRVLYLERLSAADRSLVLGARSRTGPERYFALFAGVVLVSIAAPATFARTPLWALLLASAVTWPLVVWSYTRWSLRLRSADPDKWRRLIAGEERPNTKIALTRIILPLVPAAVFLSLWRS
jgi:hypothetical protein